MSVVRAVVLEEGAVHPGHVENLCRQLYRAAGDVAAPWWPGPDHTPPDGLVEVPEGDAPLKAEGRGGGERGKGGEGGPGEEDGGGAAAAAGGTQRLQQRTVPAAAGGGSASPPPRSAAHAAAAAFGEQPFTVADLLRAHLAPRLAAALGSAGIESAADLVYEAETILQHADPAARVRAPCVAAAVTAAACGRARRPSPQLGRWRSWWRQGLLFSQSPVDYSRF